MLKELYTLPISILRESSGEGDPAIGPGTARGDYCLHIAFERHGRNPAQVEAFAGCAIVCTGDQQGVDDIVHVIQIAQLPAVSVNRDSLPLDRQTYKPSRESLARVPDRLPWAVGIHKPERDGGYPVGEAVDHMQALAGHLVYPVDIDGLQNLRLNQRQRVRWPVALAGAGINDPHIPVHLPAGLQNGQRRQGVHPEIRKRIVHGLQVADVAGDIENVGFAADEFPHEIQVATVPFDQLGFVSNGLDIEVIGTARRVQGIDNCDGRPTSTRRMARLLR